MIFFFWNIKGNRKKNNSHWFFIYFIISLIHEYDKDSLKVWISLNTISFELLPYIWTNNPLENNAWYSLRSWFGTICLRAVVSIAVLLKTYCWVRISFQNLLASSIKVIDFWDLYWMRDWRISLKFWVTWEGKIFWRKFVTLSWRKSGEDELWTWRKIP